MSAANSRAHAVTASAPLDRSTLFKEDRPRHIDQFISFFGDDSRLDDDAGDEWFER